MIKFKGEKDCIKQLMEAVKSGDEEKIQQAWVALHDSIAKQVSEDFKAVQKTQDSNILAQRGYRQLTSQETAWYQKVIDALKSKDPKQAFTDIFTAGNEEDIMPTTIIEDVFKHLQDEHPLLKKINFQYVGFVTKWILNNHTKQAAQWGEITEAIAKEITTSFKVVKVNQSKLSAYAVIEKGMLDLGPVFLDGYIRRVLADAIMTGLEAGIVAGNGLDCPAGLTRDITKGKFNDETGYPEKEAVKVVDFTPQNYGPLVAKLAVDENGKVKRFTEVTLVVNQVDYLTKVMPATTVLTAQGTYARDLFPFPTETVISNELATGKAVLFLPEEYFCGVGSPKEGTLEYDDSCKFIEDQRVFKSKLYGTGKAYDNTSAILLDISELEPAFIAIKDVAEVTA